MRNILGAFADGAVLFPLLALLSTQAGFSGATALLTTGIAYIVAAVLFRVPMSVQPLKSIAVAAVTVGASFSEIRLSGMLLGAFCLLVCLTDVERYARRVPAVIIHQLQVGLAVLLMLQGLKAAGSSTAIVVAGALIMTLLPELKRIPLLGLVATLGLLVAVISPGAAAESSASASGTVRPALIAGLLLPQLVLTSANSVLATRDVCERYFGDAAWRVTIRRLLYSIGFGNILVAMVGGMPFCHGSGGVTAHVRGGSSRAWSTGLLGVVLISLAAIQASGSNRALMYPPVLVATLLAATGGFHLKLAAPSATSVVGWLKLAISGSLTLLTRNLLWVLAAATVMECLPVLFSNFQQEVRS